MLDYKDIITKHFALGMSGAQIAESLGVSKSGVNDFLRAFKSCKTLSYLESNDASAYLCSVLSAMLKGILENNNNRLRSLLFKWAVELNMLCHTIAAHYRVDEIDRRALRAFAVEEVKRSCGQVSFDHALDVQRRAPYERAPDSDEW